MQLLQDIGKAYAALASFDCKKAISLFNALPPHQLSTCWVLQQIGTAYFEMTDYHQVPVTLLCFCQNVCCYQFICVFGVVHVKKKHFKHVQGACLDQKWTTLRDAEKGDRGVHVPLLPFIFESRGGNVAILNCNSLLFEG